MRCTAGQAPAWLALVALALVAPLGPAGAQEPARRVVPYSGQLDFDGVPVDGPVALRFRLYDDPDAPSGEACDGSCLWEEAHPTVPVYGGAFHVLLGDSDMAALEAAVAVDGQRWLELAVRPVPPEGEPAGPWRTLSGRAAIAPVPVAISTVQQTFELDGITAAESRITGSFGVTGRLAVAGSVDATTASVARTADIAGDVRITGPVDNPGAGAVYLDAPGEVSVTGGDLRVNGSLSTVHVTRPAVATSPTARSAVVDVRRFTNPSMVIDAISFGPERLLSCQRTSPVCTELHADLPPSAYACFLSQATVYARPNFGGGVPAECTVRAEGNAYRFTALYGDCRFACVRLR